MNGWTRKLACMVPSVENKEEINSDPALMVARSDCTALNFRTNQLGGSSILTWKKKKKKDSKQPACLPVNALPSLLACILSKRLRSRLPRAANHSGLPPADHQVQIPPGRRQAKRSELMGVGGWPLPKRPCQVPLLIVDRAR